VAVGQLSGFLAYTLSIASNDGRVMSAVYPLRDRYRYNNANWVRIIGAGLRLRNAYGHGSGFWFTVWPLSACSWRVVVGYPDIVPYQSTFSVPIPLRRQGFPAQEPTRQADNGQCGAGKWPFSSALTANTGAQCRQAEGVIVRLHNLSNGALACIIVTSAQHYKKVQMFHAAIGTEC